MVKPIEKTIMVKPIKKTIMGKPIKKTVTRKRKAKKSSVISCEKSPRKISVKGKIRSCQKR